VQLVQRAQWSSASVVVANGEVGRGAAGGQLRAATIRCGAGIQEGIHFYNHTADIDRLVEVWGK